MPDMSTLKLGNVTYNVTDKSLRQILYNMLIPVLEQGLYGQDQAAAIASLKTALTTSGGDTPTQTHSITNNLTNVTNSNSATLVNSGSAYSAKLTAASGMEMQSVIITMGGLDITSTVYTSSTGNIVIPSVTGNVVITAVAESLIETITGVMTAGFISANGTEGDSTSYKHTQRISVREGDKVYGSCYDSLNNMTVNKISARFTCAYGENGTAIESAGSNTDTNLTESAPYIVPANVFSVVFSSPNRFTTDVVITIDKTERVGA